MTPHEITDLSLTLMSAADAAYLTTIDPAGFPDTRAMLNLRNPGQYPGLVTFFESHRDDLTIYFSTNTSSQKIQEVLQNPKASVYYCLSQEFQGVMFSGALELSADSAVKHALWQPNWTMYYPGGVDDPDHAVLRMVPRRLKGWARLNRFALTL